MSISTSIVFNNRFASAKLTADQIGDELLKNWLDAVKNLHKAAYSVAVKCENLPNNDTSAVDKTVLFSSIRAILDIVGNVNGHKLTANDHMATLIIGYANRRGNCDSPELQLTLSRISNARKTLAIYEKTAGVNPASIEEVKTQLAELEEHKTALLQQADNRHKVVTRTSINNFRLDVEHLIARIITEQQAKTWEELEQEAEERRKARREKTKQKKNANKNANKQ